MSIQWFPGHMHKARKEIATSLKRCDIVIEVVDSRLPWSSSNPILAQLRRERQRPCLKVLTKTDLGDPAVTQQWLNWLKQQPNTAAVALNLTKPTEAKKLLPVARSLAPHRNSLEKPLRIMVAGIPNVGKSTLINALAGRKIAKTGDEPAITKTQQWVEIGNGVELLDTPGILWPKIEHPMSGFHLAAGHAIGKNAMDEISVALYIIDRLKERYPELLQTRYKLDSLDAPADILLEQIAQKRGFRTSGGFIDETKAAEVLLFELRRATIGRISFETPADIPALEGLDSNTELADTDTDTDTPDSETEDGNQ